MAAKKKAEIIRNLRGIAVHQRFRTFGVEKPYRVELQPRGYRGDCAVLPIAVCDSAEYEKGKGTLFEVITATEFKKLEETYPSIGYQGGVRTGTELVGGELVERPIEVSVSKSTDRDVARVDEGDKGVKVHMIGPKYADMPGSDKALHSILRNEEEKAEGGPQTNEDLMSMQEKVVMDRVRQHKEETGESAAVLTRQDPTDETVKVEASSHPATRGKKTQAARKPQNRAATPAKTKLPKV